MSTDDGPAATAALAGGEEGGAQGPADAKAAAEAEGDEAEAGSAEEDQAEGAGIKSKKKRRRKKKQPVAAALPTLTLPLQLGQRVTLGGLTGAVELNGAEGTLTQWDEEKGRWCVQLRSGEVKALKPDNLTVYEDAGPAGGENPDFEEWVARALAATSSGAEKLPTDEALSMGAEFRGYSFSGKLRPAYVTPQMRPPTMQCIPDYALDPEGTPHSEVNLRGRKIPVLEGVELDTMREACRLGREVLDVASRYMREGVTGDQIDRIVWQACKDRGIYPSPLNYSGFPKSVCVSPNEVICHGIPDCRPICRGDIVNLDVSIYYKEFHADLNETFFIGECDSESQALVRTAYNALRAASELIRPGTFYRDLGAAIHAQTSQGGCAVVPGYCGHGVGRLFHGPPDVPHYRRNKAVGIMKVGHVFTVEPMVNLGNNGGDRKWPDGWTAVTRDGKRSAQFEHTFLVTETGCEILTARPQTDRTAMPAFDPAMFQR